MPILSTDIINIQNKEIEFTSTNFDKNNILCSINLNFIEKLIDLDDKEFRFYIYKIALIAEYKKYINDIIITRFFYAKKEEKEPITKKDISNYYNIENYPTIESLYEIKNKLLYLIKLFKEYNLYNFIKEFIFHIEVINIYIKKYEFDEKEKIQNDIKIKNKKQGFIYIIKSKYGYKIGKSKNMKQRMNWFDIKLPFHYKTIRLYKTINYHKIEKILHRKYKSKYINGEWFDLTNEDINYIDKIMIEKYESFKIDLNKEGVNINK